MKYRVIPLAVIVGIVTFVSTQGGVPVPTAAVVRLIRLDAPPLILDSCNDVISRALTVRPYSLAACELVNSVYEIRVRRYIVGLEVICDFYRSAL